MTNYIDREELLQKAKFVHGRWDDLYVSKSEILSMPPADVQPVVCGHWIENDNGTYTCSECQAWVPNEQHYYARYCLHCGARMV